MRRCLPVLLSVLAVALSVCGCQMQEQSIPLPNLSFSDQCDASYDGVTITCTVSGNMTAEILSLEYGTDESLSQPKSETFNNQGKAFSLSLTGLKVETTYYYRYTVENKISKYTDSDIRQFTTRSAFTFKPVEVKDISATSAVVTGGVESDGGVTIETQGFCLKMDGASDYSFIPSEGEATLSNLKPETKYKVWYYAKSFKGEFESKAVEFQTTISVPEAVDLGLPSGIKWASYNVGASIPEEYGDYFAWGETEPKSDYSWSTYKWCNGSETTLTKYNTGSSKGTVDNKTQLEMSDDAARANWGGNWRMPTKAEFDELKSNCNYSWTSYNGVNGYLITSKKNGNSIFLPAAGYRHDMSVDLVGSHGYYWSSSLHMDNPSYARYTLIYSSSIYQDYKYRFYGHAVRPVYGDLISVISVSLSQTTLTLEEGKTATLTATVNPSNATDKTVTWTSSNTSVATVSEGKVSAVAAGTATITAKAGDKSATCAVTVTQTSSGPEAVDLGLPSGIKWASYNVGATKPEEYGDYFAWGETEPKSDYSWSTYKWCNGSGTTLTKYNTSSSNGTVDNKTELEMQDDAARANWGGKWRMPTKAEFGELMSNCSFIWTTSNGVNGYFVTSKKNGNCIFLPAAGVRSGTSVNYAGSYGYFWSSSNGADYPYAAWYLNIHSSFFSTYEGGRSSGQLVRPVYGDLISVTGVSLSQTTLTLEVGKRATLTATVKPDDAADYYDVMWTSSNTSVAIISNTWASGTVTAVSPGTATITAIAGNKFATCTVTVIQASSGPEAVDLGLPSGIKWASYNVGATKPEEYGDYFAWGETEPKDYYDWSTYKWCNGYYFTLTKYNYSSNYGTVDNKTQLELSDDTARANWGGNWRMPTKAEFEELQSNCNSSWTTRNGVNGCVFTSKKNGNSIFLPAAGCRVNTPVFNDGTDGDYWSSSLYTDNPDDAWNWGSSSSGSYTRCSRYVGNSVRPVTE